MSARGRLAAGAAIAALATAPLGCSGQDGQVDEALEQLDEAQREFNKELDKATKQAPRDAGARKQLKELKREANQGFADGKRTAEENR